MKLALILYDNRSGSTLLSALLNRHRGVVVAREHQFVAEVLEHRGPLDTPEQVRALLDSFSGEARLEELGLSSDDVLARLDGRGPGAVIRAVAAAYAARWDAGAEFAVLKSPRIVYHLEALRAALPDAHLLHIVRDGRAVFLSKTQAWSSRGDWMDRNVVHAAVVWRRKLRLVERSGLPVQTVRYEELLGDPERVLGGVMDAMGVPPEGRALTKGQDAYASTIAANHRQVHGNVARPPQRDRATAWVDALHPRQVRLYELLNGPLLERFGYARAAPRAPGLTVAALGLGAVEAVRMLGRGARTAATLVRGGRRGLSALRRKVRAWKAA